ncbi:L domain-like protein [Anaeromyces robustus]|uniref:L domain-like protein n=1 Tax=Anaeromyces robustus TaxID=1754192 RepID=A0A1Y1XGR0_9FUNG|nr:L domain-like protein [Anaeromyces robustus]|eukprot:ORX84882.1 L domain-like protein [Anaeromyces robustus]
MDFVNTHFTPEAFYSFYSQSLKKITLTGKAFNKVFPRNLLYIESLEYLELNNNHIINFPYQFKTLNSLKTLKLNNNNIEGELIADVLNMENLEYLDLTNNNMEGMLYIPSSLTTLITTKNKFDSIEVRSNNELEYFEADNNNFNEDIVNQLISLTNIKIL